MSGKGGEGREDSCEWEGRGGERGGRVGGQLYNYVSEKGRGTGQL